jgi:cell division protein FtsQ
MARKPGKNPKKPIVDWRLAGRWMLGLCLFAVMGSGGLWVFLKLQDPTLLPVRVVRIDGRVIHMERGRLEQSLGGLIQGNYFTLDVEALQRAAKRLPWVEQVTVRRVWPDTLRMWVREKDPLARWGKSRLISTRGVAFEPRPEEMPTGLPRLFGPDGTERKVAAGYRRMQRQLAALGLGIERLHLDARQAWWVKLDNGLELHLGNQDTENRLRRFIRAYPRLIQDQAGTLTAIDLRYTNGLAARRKKETT